MLERSKKMMRSVHDNHLLGYTVDGVARRIVLHTEYRYGQEPFERTDVVFEGVLDHYFRNPILPSIIFDVEEVETQFITSRDKTSIDEGHKIAGWPSFWRESAEAMAAAIHESGCKMFEISSSYGLDGWVAADSREFQLGDHNRNNQATGPD
jgi:hypothetical protein